ncbi:hypothetical protein GCM10022252_35460 [Streptosporangium oxazolinicum]|uniref:Uncharacterized protein n=1 Tax=Streptosporangium oxazolinicum TaxID=909287 RepID=A0ABP8AY74_9ACTN
MIDMARRGDDVHQPSPHVTCITQGTRVIRPSGPTVRTTQQPTTPTTVRTTVRTTWQPVPPPPPSAPHTSAPHPENGSQHLAVPVGGHGA